MAPGTGVEDMAEKGPSAPGGSTATPERREPGPFPGDFTLVHPASPPRPVPPPG
ncbi:mCG16670 [Mus musculus]|jgi:hypothetical protein|nr:mCG16670 [Mus musculus]